MSSHYKPTRDNQSLRLFDEFQNCSTQKTDNLKKDNSKHHGDAIHDINHNHYTSNDINTKNHDKTSSDLTSSNFDSKNYNENDSGIVELDDPSQYSENELSENAPLFLSQTQSDYYDPSLSQPERNYPATFNKILHKISLKEVETLKKLCDNELKRKGTPTEKENSQSFTNTGMEEVTNLFINNIHSDCTTTPSTASSPSSQVATSENSKKVENGSDDSPYKPSDDRLMPIRNDLASQLEPFRPFLESISTQALDYIKKIHELQSRLKLWLNFRGPDLQNPPPSMEATNSLLPDLQPSEFYVPGNMKIKKSKLFIPPSLAKDEHSRNELIEIKTRFNNSKIKFQKSASDCVKELVELQVSATHRNLCQTIVKGFLQVIKTNIVHLRKNIGVTTESTKNEMLMAACILIKFMRDLPDDFFNWLKVEKHDTFKIILNHTGEHPDNTNNYFTEPIIGDEKNFANPIMFNVLSKVFLPCTMYICNSVIKQITESEHLQVLQSDLAKKPLRDLTAATSDCLDKIADEQGQEILKDLIDERASKSAAKTARNITNKSLHTASTNNTLKTIIKEKRKKYLGAQRFAQLVAPQKRKNGLASRETSDNSKRVKFTKNGNTTLKKKKRTNNNNKRETVQGEKHNDSTKGKSTQN